MNDVTVLSAPGTASVATSRTPDRGAPKAIKLLLPVWGQRYIKQFLNISLPTLLAPGNLPALAAALPCEFVFLTSSEDAEILREHPACRYLRSFCDVDVQVIDDLITGDNYSTTITLAYARGVKAAGPAMVDTCFFFLISDYLVADGSLANVLARVQAGASGVMAGNFQVVEEDAEKSFLSRFDGGSAEIALPPRDLMKWSLAYLHPMTAGNTVNFPLCHSTHSNRLFWRVDENTLLGRFYLMHMICIRPEGTDFVVGSSCDYSFIPEMCPSGNVHVMADSDEYLVVEMQPREHENGFLRVGPKDAPSLAGSLGDWTTSRHRENVRSNLVFHAAEIPACLGDVIREADAFIAKIDRRLARLPIMPHRGHPYWIGAEIAHRVAVSRKFEQDISPEDIYREYGRGVHIVQRFRDALFGRAPAVRPWHPRWPDFETVFSEMRRLLSGRRARLLVVSKAPFVFAEWMRNVAGTVISIETRQLLAIGERGYTPLVGSFDACLVIMGESEMKAAAILTRRIAPMLRPEGFIGVSVLSGGSVATDYDFGRLITRNSGRFLGLPAPLEKTLFIPVDILRRASTAGMIALYRGMLQSPVLYAVLSVLVGPLLLAMCVIGNLLSFLFRSGSQRRGIPSSLWMVFRPGPVWALPDFSPDPELYARADRYKVAPKPVLQRVAERDRV